MSKGKIYIISGPSGVGKGTVIGELFKKLDRRWFSISATTRKPRPGEVDGVHYLFIDRESFSEMIEKDELLEYAEYNGNFYGTPMRPIMEHVEAGDDVFLDIEVQGSAQICRKIPEAVSIFIVPPTLEELGERLRGRNTESEEAILNRLKIAEEELKLAPTYDYTVVNDTVDKAVEKILDIISAERNKQEDN